MHERRNVEVTAIADGLLTVSLQFKLY